jgi:hypothetical protein
MQREYSKCCMAWEKSTFLLCRIASKKNSSLSLKRRIWRFSRESPKSIWINWSRCNDSDKKWLSRFKMSSSSNLTRSRTILLLLTMSSLRTDSWMVSIMILTSHSLNLWSKFLISNFSTCISKLLIHLYRVSNTSASNKYRFFRISTRLVWCSLRDSNIYSLFETNKLKSIKIKSNETKLSKNKYRTRGNI